MSAIPNRDQQRAARLLSVLDRMKRQRDKRRGPCERIFVRSGEKKQTDQDVAWLIRHAVGLQNHYLRIKKLSRTRREQQRAATPRWSESALIERVYRETAMWSERLGDALEVDHVVPIVSKVVCGLHVHANLQILAQDLNGSKGNRHWPDMP